MNNKLTAPDSGPDFTQCKLFFAGTSVIQDKHSSWMLHIHILFSLCTHCKQVEQICVGIDVGRCVLDHRQLLKNGVQLLGLGEVDPCFLFVSPVWQRHVHSYQVFQVHAEDWESKSRALRKAFAVLTVVPTWCHQFDEVVKNLQIGRKQGDSIIWEDMKDKNRRDDEMRFETKEEEAKPGSREICLKESETFWKTAPDGLT